MWFWISSSNVKKYIFLFLGVNILALPLTFFAVNSLLSIEYSGAENSSSYLIAIICSALPFYIIVLKRLLFRKSFSSEPLLLAVPILLIINAVFVLIFSDVATDKFIYQFLLLVLPAFLFGMELGRKEFTSSISRLLLAVALIITASVAALVPKMLLIPTNDLMTFFGGGHYQAFSYSVSLSFLITLIYYLFHLKDRTRVKNIAFIILFIIQIVGIVISGGRGGIGVVVIGTVVTLLIKYPFLKFLRIFLITVFSFVCLSVVVVMNLEEGYADRIFESAGRLVSFISADGFDFEQTSNRETVYSETVKLIGNSPLHGYGLFRYVKETHGGYPHNFFLEILLQGGILFFAIWAASFSIFFIKLARLVRFGNNHKFLLATFIYSFVQLMFSATYLLEPFFWFNFAYVFTASMRTHDEQNLSKESRNCSLN